MLATKLKKSESIGQEVGSTRFSRIADAECQRAADLWQSQRGFWTEVRRSWNSVYSQGRQVQLKGYRQIGTLMEMGDRFAADDKVKSQVDQVIQNAVIVTP